MKKTNWGVHLAPAFCAILLLLLAVRGTGAEQRFPVLQAGGITYSNVVVTGTSARDVFIRHSAGLSTLKAVDLDASTRVALGFTEPTPVAASTPAGTGTNRPGFFTTFKENFSKGVEAAKAKARAEGREVPDISPLEVVLRLVCFFLLFIWYLAFCRSCRRLCRRAGAPSDFLVWLPSLKWLALFKATNLSRWWYVLGLVLPLIGFGAWIVCCLRLCDMFHRTRWWLAVMLVPFLGWLPFMYLDWSSRDEDYDPAVQSQDRVRLAA